MTQDNTRIVSLFSNPPTRKGPSKTKSMEVSVLENDFYVHS